MALKNYEWRGFTWQFEESEAPADAKLVAAKAKAAKQPADKAAKQPSNKSRAAAKKAE